MLAFPHCRYLLYADTSRYYTTIYTHSISWALHGKSVAKERRHDKSLLGNQLDELVRATQDSQSVGIPIGPDTSLIISEIIGTAIDLELRERLSAANIKMQGHRYLDD
jgi:hypothetical protein